MVSTALLTGLAATAAWLLWGYIWYRPRNFPPGPPRIPLFGSYLLLLWLNYDQLHRAVQRLCSFYASPIVGFYHGPLPVVVCTDLQSVREALRNTALDGKPDIVLSRLRAPENVSRGLFFTHGNVWRDNRRFALRHLRDYGYGRRQLAFELDVEAELMHLLRIVRHGAQFEHQRAFARSGGRMLCPNMFWGLMGNSVLRALCNEMVDADDATGQRQLYEAGASATEFALTAEVFGRMFSILPFLPYVAPGMSDYAKCRQSAMGVYAVAERLVRRQWQTYEEQCAAQGANDDAEDERSFVEFYFREMRMGGNEESFNMEQLMMTFVDFLVPATTTVPAALSFMIQRWIEEPEVLERIQAECDSVVGRSRLPTLDDRANMPYTEAALRELLRHRTPLTLGAPHFALEDTTLCGYSVPKGSVVLTGLQNVHWDEAVFTDARAFRPERFLDADSGKLLLSADVSLPFAAGKRLCAGETFSRNMLFVVMATLAQQFNVRCCSGDEDAKATGWSTCDKQIRTGLISFPTEKWVQFTDR